LTLNQGQKGGLFEFPLEIAVVNKNGQKVKEIFKIESKQAKFELISQTEPVDLILDPATKLLFEATIQKK
jgi:hypothetical protein